MANFQNQTAIVTGAGSGIGRELARQLARLGARLAITDLFQDRVDALVKELTGPGAEAKAYAVDHAQLSKVEKFFRDFSSDFRQVDVLCLNAGVGMGARIEQYKIEDWEWILNNNLWSVIYMLQLFLPGMIEQKQGKILITASGAGLIGIPGLAPYCASKFALVGLGESLRAELKKYNINVSVLCPGIINTNIVRDGRIYIQDQSGESVKGKVAEFYSRFGARPEEVARDGIRALSRDRGIQPSPLHMWPVWLLKRVSPGLYQSIARLVWRKGWLV